MACCILLALIISQIILLVKKIKFWFGIADEDDPEVMQIQAHRKRKILKSLTLVVTFLVFNALLIYMNQDHVRHFMQQMNAIIAHQSIVIPEEHQHF
jgi:hypothetical protein